VKLEAKEDLQCAVLREALLWAKTVAV